MDLAYLEAQKLVFVDPATKQQSTLHHCNTIYTYILYICSTNLRFRPSAKSPKIHSPLLILSFSLHHSFPLSNLAPFLSLSLSFSLSFSPFFHDILKAFLRQTYQTYSTTLINFYSISFEFFQSFTIYFDISIKFVLFRFTWIRDAFEAFA